MIGLALTPEQYKTLLRMVYIANTVVNGHRDEDFAKEYDDMEQYVFSRAKDAGFPAATAHHKMAGEEHHHPSRIFENDPEVNAILDQYDAHILVELLSEKLAERDIAIAHGPGIKEKMSEGDYLKLLEFTADSYDKEFLANGLKNLFIRTENEQ